jgi:hypothetical protein
LPPLNNGATTFDRQVEKTLKTSRGESVSWRGKLVTRFPEQPLWLDRGPMPLNARANLREIREFADFTSSLK